MSLLLFIFYWVVIPLLVLLVTIWLFSRAKSPLIKLLVVASFAAVLWGFWWIAGGEQRQFDQQVGELCAKDGGVKVYATVRLPTDRFDKYGGIRIPLKRDAKTSDDYYYESSMTYLKTGNPEMWKLHFKVYRRSDNKLLGESISYARRGGDLPGPWHESSFGCPNGADISDLNKLVFVKIN